MANKLSKEYRENHEKQLVRDFFDHKPDGYFVDVGANDPTSIMSQSHHLEDNLNWSGVLVEPNPQLAEQCRSKRPQSKTFECACVNHENHSNLTLYIPLKNGQEMDLHAGIDKNIDDFNYKDHKEVTVKARTLNSILAEVNAPEIDLLSIDVEGAELQVLQGLNFDKYNPKLILLEDKHLYLTKHRFLKKHGYKLIKRTGFNFWYAPIGSKRMPQSFSEKFKIFKRMYVSIWLKKISYSIKHKTLKPFTTL